MDRKKIIRDWLENDEKKFDKNKLLENLTYPWNEVRNSKIFIDAGQYITYFIST